MNGPLVVATRSAHKLQEIRRILGGASGREGKVDLGLRIVGLDEFGLPVEDGEDGVESFETFEENALAKACHFFVRAGAPTVADDSGIEVDALGGAPGVRSRRFAPAGAGWGGDEDQANNAYLVERLAGVPHELRTARYICVVAVVGIGPEPILIRREAEGVILERPRGSGGFGYDPYFGQPGSGRSFAELEPAEKDAVSHRGRAFREMARRLGGPQAEA